MSNKMNENLKENMMNTAVPFATTGTKIHFIKCSYNDLAEGRNQYINGDAILLESNGKFALIDTGEGGTQESGGTKTSNVTKLKVIPYLKSVMGGSNRLEFFLGTHAHSDHIDGVPQILDDFIVPNIYISHYINEYIGETEKYDNLAQYDKAAEVAGDKLQSIPASLTLGEMKLTFINQNKTSATTENQRSTVTVIQANGQTAVLMGDFGCGPNYNPNDEKSNEEVEMAKSIKNIISTPVGLLKIGHHRVPSSSSQTFLNVLMPKKIVNSGSGGSNSKNGELDDWLKAHPSTPIYHTYPSSVLAYVATFNSTGITVQGTGSSSDNITVDAPYIPGPPETQGTWRQEGGKWYFISPSGKKVIGLATIKGVKYFFDANGVMQTGWILINGKDWYYFDTTGAGVTGWKNIGGEWYYLDPNKGGIMAKGWLQEGKYWYFLQGGGAAKKGWLNDAAANVWFYFEEKDPSQYKFPLCAMYQSMPEKGNSFVINGKTYRFDEDGHCLNP